MLFRDCLGGWWKRWIVKKTALSEVWKGTLWWKVQLYGVFDGFVTFLSLWPNIWQKWFFWNEGLFLASGSWDTVHHRKEDMPAGVMVGLWWSDCVTHFFISWWIREQKAWKKWYKSTWRPTSGDLLTVFASCPNGLKSPQTVLQTGTKCFNTQACGEH